MTLEQIGKYRVTGELGRGGMGIVYRGEDPLIGRAVAIKTLTEVTPELRERFYLEARSGILNHPNIVTVYELGEHAGNPFIAMEFIEGESLEKMLRRQRRLSLPDALSIVEQICAGLGHAHAHGVVHRDIKPANILVQADGHVKIVDFGIARLSDQTRQLTKTDALLGTFHYIAPERLKGEANDGRGDIWSTGIMLYEMLTGELPFKGKDIASLYRVIYELHVPLSEYVHGLPEELSNVLNKALAKRAEDRYATAEEMAFDLQVISNPLRQGRVNEFLAAARRLAEEQQFASARVALLRAQSIDPGNAEVKALITDVQDRLSHLQRGEQLRQVFEQAQVAQAERRWDDAIAGFQQAQKLDLENVFDIEERLQKVQDQRRHQQKVAALWERANEARSRGDLTGAQEYLGQALRIDEHSTDLQNAHAMILREIRRRQQGIQVEELLRSARERYGNRQYTEAIDRLREAAEIDPDHAAIQELLFTAASRQKEERRQVLLEKIAAEIRESLDREDFAQAQDRVARALETLPAESLLLRLKSETEARKRDFETQQAVRTAIQQAQELFDEHPDKALRAIEKGLEQAPDNDALLQVEARLREHLSDIQKDAARTELLRKAHAAMDARNYADAVRLLEDTVRLYGSNEDLEHLLDVARREQQNEQRKIAEAKETEEARAALKEAVQAFEKALTAADFARCMRPLDDVAKRRGESFVAGARQECETKRRQRAEQILDGAIRNARQSLEGGSFKVALSILRKAERANPFAGSSVQNEFERIRKECEAASKQKRTGKDSTGKHGLWYAAGAALLTAVLATGALLRAHREVPAQKVATVAPVSVVPYTYMEINASPWAKILRVQDSNGKDVVMSGTDEATPLRLEGIAEGRYKVDLVGPGGSDQTVDCNVSSTKHLCMAEMSPIDIQQVLDGGKQ
jgi:eukaryotic-like serine/threonine-protein kinase